MEHKQHPNAFAYVIYERATNWTIDEGIDAPWRRTQMFYADDPAFSSRDAAWSHHVEWRDPKNIRVDPLFDEDGNDAIREAHLDDINARYQSDTNGPASLASAVETALETDLPVERFEGLLRTLEAFDIKLSYQLQIPPNTVERAEYLPSVEQLAALKQFTQ